jgi:hypothetical protein
LKTTETTRERVVDNDRDKKRNDRDIKKRQWLTTIEVAKETTRV